MSRNKTVPGTGLFLSVATAIGLVRGVQDVAEETTRSSEPVSPHTYSAPDDEDTGLIARVGLGVLLTTWAVILLIYPFFQFLKYDRTGGKNPAKALVDLPKQPPEPRNVNHPYRVWADFDKAQQGQLKNYYWIDKGKGIVAIPIDRAMQIIAQKGVPPSKPAASPNEYYPPMAGSMRTGFQDKVEPEQQ